MHKSLVSAMEHSSLPKSNQTTLINRCFPQTIHRLLGPVHGSVDFKHDAENPVPYDLVLIDESSMVDLSMATFAKLCLRIQN